MQIHLHAYTTLPPPDSGSCTGDAVNTRRACLRTWGNLYELHVYTDTYTDRQTDRHTYIYVCIYIYIYTHVYDVATTGLWVVNRGPSDHQSRLYSQAQLLIRGLYKARHGQGEATSQHYHIGQHTLRQEVIIYTHIYTYIYIYIYI